MRYLFDDYELNTETQELSYAGQQIPLTPKAYAVLAHLIVNRDRLVSKDELLDEIWPDTYVDDSAVKRNIMAVRRAIGDRSSTREHIVTQRARGYRFVTPVRVWEPQAADASDTATQPPAPTMPTTSQPSSAPTSVPLSLRPAIAEAAERKLVTALYCMVSHTTDASGEMDLDTLHSLMQTVYTYTYEEAQRYGGTVSTLRAKAASSSLALRCLWRTTHSEPR
ncbi:hypothetical protein C2W62_04830 [Candidatus Entotheonella serta]|nr:hypothetical protein C2W62_04830 [Candidatus Entotheonella serta]